MKRLVVLGAGESGVGTAILAQKEGYDVFVSDMGCIKDNYKEQLTAHSLAWEEKHHTEELILNADEIVKSPGIPGDAPMVKKAVEKGIPILSEIEFAGRYTDARMICITGSNGKTTTTSLIFHILQKAGFSVGLAGNIGRSMALQVATTSPEWFVLEISSFQLENMYDFRANIAVLLNITPDHLDRYDYKMQGYVDAKMRIIRNQQPTDYFIYWKDDEYIEKELKKYDEKAHLCTFADERKEGVTGYAENGSFVLTAPADFTMTVAELALQGRHNVRNSLAAAAAALAAEVPEQTIREGLQDFRGVPHRLEKVGTVDGVHYINDSKATNVDACYYALDAMTTPVVLIIGGKDKGNDYNEILPLVKEKCRALVFLGADNTKLKDFFRSTGITIADTHSMKDCVEACKALAHQGDTVLLSPCCASFDLFNNMAERGNMFKEMVLNRAK
ncbi:UDP-N-acetylmuramoyl-L-alanine--D-glutamate ligase [Pseudoprevotella muciniphila]|uniref:UDP-N-acetylmuramoylalanine--D-glutamate ligase n=1 Tax=Pseudoprevotella muciniphila TaxID=2133944 RepID=A0A5P8E8G9_9BACT|nr:UDP-N-acetylmuramoyl-L-alanine--D-glutamate ligase [Pseudoprevotella muciniphila]QFQ13190.1 UDP-N-acetylmuramoyl-L-alanine--D-glutamate ligase [Pseudoprevotella muciniphila]